MITYDPFFATCAAHGISGYALRQQGVSPATLNKLKHNGVITTQMIDKLCHLLDCTPADIISYSK